MNLIKSNRAHHLILFTLGAVLMTVPAIANPSSRDASRALAIHATVPEATALAASAQAIADEADKFLALSEATAQKRGPDGLSPKQLSYFRGNIPVASLNAGRLQIMGEPIAADLSLRLTSLQGRTQELVRAYMSTPAGSALRPKLIGQLAKSIKPREKQLEAIRKMLDGNQLDEAEAAMDKLRIEIQGLIHFLFPDEYKPHMGTYWETDGLVTSKLAPKRTADARAKIQEAIAANQPDLSEMKTWASAVAGSLQKTGTAPGEDQKQLTGPECITELSRHWGAAHAALQRVAGLQWAMRANSASAGSASATSAGANESATAWSSAALLAMSDIIKADAMSVSPEAVPARHQAYLAVIGEMAIMGDRKAVFEQANQSLNALLAKNSVYQNAVVNYRAATQDVLVFQRRLADQAMKPLMEQFGSADTVIQENTKSVGVSPGLFPTQTNQPVFASLMFPATPTMASITPNLLDKKVSVEHLVPVGPKGNVGAAKINGRTYSTVPVVSLPEQVITQIQSMLLVDSSHPELSIEAKHAIHSASVGQFEAVGGVVKAAQIEPVVSRFVTMTEATAVILPRGTELARDDRQSMLNQVAIRVDLQPLWVHFGIGVFDVESDRTLTK